MSDMKWFKHQLESTVMSIRSCCSSVFEFMPDEQLHFLPSLLLGVFVSAALLIYLIQKDTKKSYSQTFWIFLKQLFSSYPMDDSEERELDLQLLVDKAKLRLSNKSMKISKRIKVSVEDFVENCRGSNGNFNLNSCLRIDELASHPLWTEFNAYDAQKEIIIKALPKIKKEFQTVFEDYQKGITKKWTKVEVLNGFSCSYSLVNKGVINTLNCQPCPATFQVLNECHVMGLSGCLFGSASFTLLYPDSCIAPSPALTNGLIRCEVVLQLGGTAGKFVVSGQQVNWKEDDIVLYDASLPHTSSLGDSKSMNVVATPLALLVIDFWHPDLYTLEKQALAQLFAA